MDEAHDWTDGRIDALTRKFHRVYSKAAKEMREKLDEFLEDYDQQRVVWEHAVKSGDTTEDKFKQWRERMALDKRFMTDLTQTLAEGASQANKLARNMVNDALPQVYSENANRAAFEIEKAWGEHSFDLVDESTVRRLMGMTEHDQVIHEVIPVGPPRPDLQSLRVDLDAAKDVRWNRQKFTASLTQSILQGESIPKTAKRLMKVLNMDENMATRAARTAMTSAENMGRVDSYKRAKALGIDLEQQWIATLDQRTRHSHRQLDGQHVPVGEKFHVDGIEIEFPGDPSVPPAYTYNCRCTLVAWFEGIEKEDPERAKKLEGMTYEEWKTEKLKVPKEEPKTHTIAEGKDILGTWERRPDQFDFEIEDIINAQGFDGKPRIVDADEFDRAVREANGGNGFIMQRVYSAPNQETLDAYRESLYDGKWYVDCSHGNDTYGKGMYTASSKSASVTQQMADEVAPYRRKFSYTETMTLDPSARVIGYNEAVAAKNDASVLERAIVGSDDISETERAIVRREVLREYSEEDRALAKSAEKEWDFDEYMAVIKKYSQREREFRELGTSEVASLLGYDAVEVPGLNYTVVLNRTKLIIRRPE